MQKEFKTIVSGIELTITNPDQIMNMGGPWICTLSLKDKFISDNSICENFIFDDAIEKLFFVKAHKGTYGWYFTINYYSFEKDQVFEFQSHFDMVFIKQFISANELEIYNAFHDKLIEYRDVFHIDSEALN